MKRNIPNIFESKRFERAQLIVVAIVVGLVVIQLLRAVSNGYTN